MKKEEEVELIIWDWLKTKSCFVKEVYFNRKNIINWKTFRTKGINAKPDFLVCVNMAGKEEYLAIEIKDNSSSNNIIAAGKILDLYYLNYINDHTKYFIDNKEISIDYFLVASQGSLSGCLYQDETFKLAEESKNKSKKYVASIGLIPPKEGSETHQFVRNIWSMTSRMSIYTNGKRPAIGILIGNSFDNGAPYIFCKKYITNKIRGNHWSQRFIKI